MRRFLLAALVAACPLAPGLHALAAETLPGPYSAEILRVIDGDTVEARVRIWLGQDVTVHIRLRGIDAPEMHGHCPGEREAAAAARDALARMLAVGPVSATSLRSPKEIRHQADQPDDDQIDGDDVVEQPRLSQNQDAGDQGNDRLDRK